MAVILGTFIYEAHLLCAVLFQFRRKFKTVCAGIKFSSVVNCKQ